MADDVKCLKTTENDNPTADTLTTTTTTTTATTVAKEDPTAVTTAPIADATNDPASAPKINNTDTTAPVPASRQALAVSTITTTNNDTTANTKDLELKYNNKDNRRKERDELAKAVTDMSLNPKRSFEPFVIRANGNAYECNGRTGKGSFGVVYKAVVQASKQTVAIKKVLQDPNYKNRELQIMRMVKHPNTVELIDSFYQRDKEKGEVFLNLILGYMPENLFEVSSRYAKRNEQMPMAHIQAYIWQLCRALGYIHNLGICHRDIKPQNLLINSETQSLRLCDFGSAKILVRGEQNVSYICSRYYRAPELIFGASFYTPAIDIWSTGCVMAELILGTPLFAGDSGIDQLVEIIKVLGTPTRKQIHSMNPEYKDYNKFPAIKRHPWDKLFPPDTPQPALDLMARMLRYTPSHRILPLEALCHPFFDEFKKIHSGSPNISIFFDFSSEELHAAYELGILKDLFPFPSTASELKRLSNRYDMDKPPKRKRVYHPTSESSSSSGEDQDQDDEDEDDTPSESSSEQEQ